MQTINTTRGVSYNPNVAARQREVERQIRRARLDAEAAENERQIRQCYSEHMPGQRRYAGWKKAQS